LGDLDPSLFGGQRRGGDDVEVVRGHVQILSPDGFDVVDDPPVAVA